LDNIDGVDKCGHGSILDENNMGGINKDTSSECFSPHARFHARVASMAEEVKDIHIVLNIFVFQKN
jgi:hypothetical protein